MTTAWIDSLRIFPRVVLVLYMIAVGTSLDWYLSFDIVYKTECDANTLTALLDRKIGLEEAERISCTITDAVGRPAGYTALMSVLIGAGAGIFGLYVNSGSRKEDK
jgi:hypothetical protein